MTKKVLLKGPLLTRSGYGEQARFALRSLRSRSDLFDVYIQPIKWGTTSWIVENDEEREFIDQTIHKTNLYIQNGGRFDMSIQVTIPNEFQKLAPINIGYTAGIETTKVAHEWLQKSNEMDKIIVVSSHSRDVFLSSIYQAINQAGEPVELRLNKPIDSVNYPVKHFEKLPSLELGLTTSYNFLCVAQFGPRKNLPNTIRWFLEEFKNDDVGLIVKTNISKNSLMDREMAEEQLKMLVSHFSERKCKVYLIHGDMTDQEMHSLYQNRQIDAFLSLTHGEGFGLPIFEAAYSGLPVVATGWSGQLDFLSDGTRGDKFFSVAYDIQPVQKEVVWPGVIIEDSMWAYPREDSAKKNMRQCYDTRSEGREKARKYASKLYDRFDPDFMYSQFIDSILGKQSLKPEPITGISFCIPTNGKRVDETLLAIKSIQSEMGAFPHEIILAGDVEKFTALDGVSCIELVEDAQTGRVGKLRNAAGKQAKYDTIAWCDDDILLDRHWLKNTISFSNKNGWNVLGCKILNPDGTRHWDRATLQPHTLVDYDHVEYDKELYQTSGFFLVRKKVFNDVMWGESNIIKSNNPEDVAYSNLLKEKGYTLSFNKEAAVWHNDNGYTELNNMTLLKKTILSHFGKHFESIFQEEDRNFILLKENLFLREVRI